MILVAFIEKITKQREENSAKFPDKEDLEGAAFSLMRLQDVYNLDTRDMANGKILDVNGSRVFTGMLFLNLLAILKY